MITKVHVCKYGAMLVMAFHIYHLTYLTFSKIFYTVCSETKVDIMYVTIEPYARKSNSAEQISFFKKEVTILF